MIKITVAYEVTPAQYEAIQRDVELYIERDINIAGADVVFERDDYTTVDYPLSDIAESIMCVVQRAIQGDQS